MNSGTAGTAEHLAQAHWHQRFDGAARLLDVYLYVGAGAFLSLWWWASGGVSKLTAWWLASHTFEVGGGILLAMLTVSRVERRHAPHSLGAPVFGPDVRVNPSRRQLAAAAELLGEMPEGGREVNVVIRLLPELMGEYNDLPDPRDAHEQGFRS